MERVRESGQPDTLRVNMHLFAIAALLAVTQAAETQSPRSEQGPEVCVAPEVVAGAAEYNRLACQGIDLMAQGRNREAIEILQQALAIKLFEQPNHRLLPRLALATFRAGLDAQEALEEAELATELLVGVLRCQETDDGFRIVSPSTRQPTSRLLPMVAHRMCGAAYDYYYVWPDLRAFLLDAALVEYLQEVRAEILGNED
jgi:hypothetical protein